MLGNNEQITKFIKTTKRRNRGVFHWLKLHSFYVIASVAWQSPGMDTLKSDDAMFCLPAKTMRLWRDVCFRHVADKKNTPFGCFNNLSKTAEF